MTSPRCRACSRVHQPGRRLDRSAAPHGRFGRRAAELAGAGLAAAGLAAAGLAAAGLAAPQAVLAHGPVPPNPPTPLNLAFGWSFDPWIWIPLLAAGLLWRSAVRRVNAAHPTNPVPRSRTWFFVGGLAAVAVALQSGIEEYDTSLFWIHMIQHLLLTMVAAPLFALSGPVTLLLRVASPADRRRWILPVLHSRIVRFATHPVVAWLVFAGVAWGTHFSPLYNAALEDRLVHDLEHALLFGSGLLFWWPAAGVDPTPWRLSYPARLLYVGLQMPQNTFLSLAIYSASEPLYPHYATLVRPWGPTPLADQQLGGGIMWVAGDLMFLVVALALLWAWMEAETRATARSDARADVERASIRARELALAERRAGGDWGAGIGTESTGRDARGGEEGSAASLR
jgi:putative copper resistance protein D